MKRMTRAIGAALLAAALPAAALADNADRIVVRSTLPNKPAAKSQEPGRIVIRSKPPASTPSAPPKQIAGTPIVTEDDKSPPKRRRPAPKPVQPRVAPAPNADAGVFELDDIDASMWESTGRGNVRQAPTTASRVIGKLAKDDTIKVMGRVKGSEWYAVDFEGDFGFIHQSVGRPVDDHSLLASAVFEDAEPMEAEEPAEDEPPLEASDEMAAHAALADDDAQASAESDPAPVNPDLSAAAVALNGDICPVSFDN